MSLAASPQPSIFIRSLEWSQAGTNRSGMTRTPALAASAKFFRAALTKWALDTESRTGCFRRTNCPIWLRIFSSRRGSFRQADLDLSDRDFGPFAATCASSFTFRNLGSTEPTANFTLRFTRSPNGRGAADGIPDRLMTEAGDISSGHHREGAL